MNIKFVMVIAVIVGILALAFVWFFFLHPSAQTTTPQQQSVTFPSSGTVTTNPSSTASGASTMLVGSLSGNAIVTSDCIHNGTTIPDTANAGHYLLAGNLGYCVSDPQKCQAGPTTDFNVFYDSTNGSFTVALLKEPLGQVRVEMEQFLMQTLGITQEDMCRLNYYVGTTSSVNPRYDSKNLGFSFCPGATALP